EVRRRLDRADDEDRALDGGAVTARVVEAANEIAKVLPRGAGARADRRGGLVHRPAVADCDVESLRGHPPPRLDTSRVPGGGVRRDPVAPAGVAEPGGRVEVRTERSDPPRLVWPERRLVRGEGWDRDVVLRARCLVRGERRREPDPVRRGVERESHASTGR